MVNRLVINAGGVSLLMDRVDGYAEEIINALGSFIWRARPKKAERWVNIELIYYILNLHGQQLLLNLYR